MHVKIDHSRFKITYKVQLHLLQPTHSRAHEQSVNETRCWAGDRHRDASHLDLVTREQRVVFLDAVAALEAVGQRVDVEEELVAVAQLVHHPTRAALA